MAEVDRGGAGRQAGARAPWGRGGASTEEYDRGEKLRHHQSLPSLREVVFVSHRAPELTLHRRGDGGWTAVTAGRGEALTLASVPVRVEVDEATERGSRTLPDGSRRRASPSVACDIPADRASGRATGGEDLSAHAQFIASF